MKRNIFAFCLSLILLCGCDLDYTNTGAISPDNVWSDKTMINAFLTDIYGRMMPGWSYPQNGTDEAMNGPGSLGSYERGQINIDNCGQNLSYANIDRINFFLDQLESVTVLTDEEKKQFRGQALFWRAWDYWGKVWTVGGVPLILHFQDVTNIESLYVTRAKTSECVAQIIADLDEAIASLPDSWSGSDYGRIDKGIAMAYKGRVLLQYASPLFNRNNDQSRWQAAYDANKKAIEFLSSHGKGLYQGDFADIWYKEQNCEAIMVNQYYYPDHNYGQNATRPEPLTKDNANYGQPIFPMIMAFPKADGTPLELDINKLSDEAYNDQFMTDFYTNRDPRFYATIFCPGTEYPSKDMLTDGKKYWNTWRKLVDNNGEEYIETMVKQELDRGVGAGYCGYFNLKGVDKDLTIASIYEADVDWIEIRYAEVLTNMAEAANEIGKTSEAIDVLKQIRQRAGINNTTGNYGITATTKEQVREAIFNERFIEFANEGKRWSDIRRLMKFDMLNKIKYRATLRPFLKDNDKVNGFDWTKDMYDPEVRKLFYFEYVECVDGDKQYCFNLDLNHWFYPLSKNMLDRNSKLEQNNEWDGTFDPLQ